MSLCMPICFPLCFPQVYHKYPLDVIKDGQNYDVEKGEQTYNITKDKNQKYIAEKGD